MKITNRKTASVLLAIALLCTALMTSCEKDAKEDPEDTAGGDAYTADTLSEEEYLLYNIADAQSAYPGISAVLTFVHDGNADDSVTYDEYRCYQLSYKEYFDYGDESYWDANPDMEARVKQLYLDEILRNHAVLSECRRYGLMLSEEERDALNRENAQLVADFGGKEYFDDALEQRYMTEFIYNFRSELEILNAKLEAYYKETGEILTDDSDIRGLLNTDDYICCKHILVKNDVGDDPAANRALAEDILAKLQGGADFDEMMTTYSEDADENGEIYSPEGYYFFHGELDENFEEAAFSLAEGELSGIVESAYGYHIILRCKKLNTYLDENFASIKESYLGLRFYQVLDAVVSDWEIRYCEDYDVYADWSKAGVPAAE